MKNCKECTKSNKAPILNESKQIHLLSENMKYHVNKMVPIYNSPLKKDVKKYVSLIKEARKLYSRGIINLNEVDTSIVKSNLGDKAEYNGKEVPLDLPIKGVENPEDVISMDIPLFIRMLEYAREDAKTDMDLHDVTEKAIALSQTGDVLDMSKYEDIVGKKLDESYEMYHRNPNTKQVSKLTFKIYEQEFNVNRVRNKIEEILSTPINELMFNTKNKLSGGKRFIPPSFKLNPRQVNLLIKNGAKASMGRPNELLIPPDIQMDLNTRNSYFKKEFENTFAPEKRQQSSMILNAIKNSINSGNRVNMNGVNYFVLKGNKEDDSFSIPNPYLEKNITESINTTSVEVDMETENGSEFTIKGKLSYMGYEGDYDVIGYKLVDGSYEEENEEDINQYIDSHDLEIEEALIDEQLKWDEYAEDEQYEYNPE